MPPLDFRSMMTNGYSGRYGLDPDQVIGIAIHHTVTRSPPTAPPADEREHLRAIERNHIQQGFGLFGYHLAVFPSGNIYYCGDLFWARAHVGGRNDELIGIALIGDFTALPPPRAQLEAAAEAVAFVRDTYPDRPIGAHRIWARHAFPTACPGDTWRDWLPSLDPAPVAADPGLDELVTFLGNPVTVQVLVYGPTGDLVVERRQVTYRQFIALHAAGLVVH